LEVLELSCTDVDDLVVMEDGVFFEYPLHLVILALKLSLVCKDGEFASCCGEECPSVADGLLLLWISHIRFGMGLVVGRLHVARHRIRVSILMCICVFSVGGLRVSI
jgi:hypothetical protein